MTGEHKRTGASARAPTAGANSGTPLGDEEALSARDAAWLGNVRAEFIAGFRALRDAHDAVTVYGSARVREGSPVYELARQLGAHLAGAGFTVITGGGPGVMEAANRGASEAGGISIGLMISLRSEEPPNRFATATAAFKYFFVRKLMLVKSAMAFVLMPGGLGTIDELFETLNLIQTGKVHRFPVVLVGSTYWRGMLDWLREVALDGGYISESDLDIFVIADTAEEVVRIINHWRSTHDMHGLEAQALPRPSGALD